MPQMAPLMWLPLMLMIVVAYVIFMTINYFFTLAVSDEKSTFKSSLMEKTWKW
uniref:ATP synthase F0 subunit 8 n=1 Tax=Trypaea australiensis TaxID=1593259 RepID=A0A0S2IA46_9EUCA|nr:ATP synthase F0 subunit 8 [Trypaea australiensis]ALO20096.1 ATP synthase F0 subunit 8 [Trypaea australiensis]